MIARRPTPTESAEQQSLVEWFDHYARSKGIDQRLLFSIPNGSNKSIATAMRFKREGLRKGAPDLMLAYPTRLFPGLFIEMKRKGEKARPDQVDFCSMLRRMGYNAVICLGADEAMRAIKAYVEAK